MAEIKIPIDLTKVGSEVPELDVPGDWNYFSTVCLKSDYDQMVVIIGHENRRSLYEGIFQKDGAEIVVFSCFISPLGIQRVTNFLQELEAKRIKIPK